MKAVLALALLVYSASAQSPSSGFVYYSPTMVNSFGRNSWGNSVGGGYDGVFWKGLGIGGDLGWFWPGSRLNSGIGLGSLNGGYHLAPRGKVDPFVTAGYGFLFRSGWSNMGNFGGGVNWWFRDTTAVRLEVRDHSDFRSRSDHIVSFRIGLGFR